MINSSLTLLLPPRAHEGPRHPEGHRYSKAISWCTEHMAGCMPFLSWWPPLNLSKFLSIRKACRDLSFDLDAYLEKTQF